MGSKFCSRARSLEASCHSRESVLGGGGAKAKGMGQSFMACRQGSGERQKRKGKDGHTSCTNTQRYQTGNADESHRVEEDFEAITGLTDGGPGTMWTKRDVVGCRGTSCIKRRRSLSRAKTQTENVKPSECECGIESAISNTQVVRTYQPFSHPTTMPSNPFSESLPAVVVPSFGQTWTVFPIALRRCSVG